MRYNAQLTMHRNSQFVKTMCLPERAQRVEEPGVFLHRHRYLRTTTLLLATIALAPSLSHAQGCTQCRDNAASTPPATRRAYRNAIALLTITATGIFTGAVFLLRRSN
jgi:hypothetical protein